MALTEFAPAQLPQHFAENDNFSTQPIYTQGGAWYQFLPDEVGSFASGGGTSQIFIYKSIDLGVTWTDITPVAPQKFTGPVGQIFIRSGTVVFTPVLNLGGFWKMFGFDLATESWIADGPNTASAVPIAATNEGMQAAARADGTIVIVSGVFGTNVSYPDHAPVMMVYDPGSATWTVEPTEVTAALSFSQVVAGGIDSVNHAHFFAVLWSGGAFGSGSATLQHFVVKPDNSIVGPNLAYTFVNIPDTVFPWVDVGEPAFYLDVTPGTRKMTLAVGTRDNALPFLGNITGLILLTAVEADVPVWSTVNVPTAEDFTLVTLANSQVAADFVASLLPVQFSTQTTLEIFWTSNGQAIAPGLNPWDNYARHISYTDGAFSGVTTDFVSLGTKIMPGPIYPVLLSNAGGVAQVGGMTPTIDFSLFVSQVTKYDALKNYWLSYSVLGPPPSPSGGPARLALPAPAGGMGRLFPSAEMRSRRICPPDPPFRKACKKAKEARYLLDDYPHVVAPPISEQVYVEQSVAAPANGLPVELLIYEVPEGYWFRLTGLIASFAGVSFVDGSGQTSWTLDVDSPTDVGGFVIQPVLPSGYVVPGFNNVRSHMGSFDFGCFQIGQPLIFHGLETVRLKVVTTAPFPGPGSGVIFNSAIQGYLWAAERN